MMFIFDMFIILFASLRPKENIFFQIRCQKYEAGREINKSVLASPKRKDSYAKSMQNVNLNNNELRNILNVRQT